MQIKAEHRKIRFSPAALFVHGLCILPAFIFQEVLYLRIFQMILFLFLSLFLAGSLKEKGKQLVFSFFTFLFILVFNSLVPHGEVFFNLFSFPVTRGALETGLFKGTVFTGLLALSRITIMKDLILPGPVGKMVSKVFYYFERLKEIQGKFKTKDVVKRIDSILLDIPLLVNTNDSGSKEQEEKTSKGGIILIVLSVLFHWGLLALSIIY